MLFRVPAFEQSIVRAASLGNHPSGEPLLPEKDVSAVAWASVPEWTPERVRLVTAGEGRAESGPDAALWQ